MPNEQATDDPPVSADDEFSQAWDTDVFTAPSEGDPSKEETPKEEVKEETPEADTKDTPAAEETKPEDDSKESTPKEEETSRTALEDAEERARKLFANRDQKDADDSKESTLDTEDPETKKEPEEEPRKPLKKREKIENSKDYAKSLVDRLDEGDRKERLSDVIKDYPEVVDLAVLLAESTSQQADPPAVPEGLEKALESVAGMASKIEQLEQQLDSRKEVDALRDYESAVEREVPGGVAISRTEGFNDWLDAQSVGVQMLAETPDPANGAKVLKAFQEHQASKKAQDHDAKSESAAADRTASLRSVGGSSRGSSAEKRASSSDDYSAGWDLEPPERYRHH